LLRIQVYCVIGWVIPYVFEGCSSFENSWKWSHCTPSNIGSDTMTQHYIPDDMNAQETFCYCIWLVLKKKTENEDWFNESYWVSFVTIWFWTQRTGQQCGVYSYAYINQVNTVVKCSAVPLFYFTYSTTIIADKARRFNYCESLRNPFSLYLFVLSWQWFCVKHRTKFVHVCIRFDCCGIVSFLVIMLNHTEPLFFIEFH